MIDNLSWVAAYPEILLLVMACVILLVDLAVKTPLRDATYLLTLLTLGGVALLTGVYASTGQVLVGFGGMIISDPMGNWLKCFASLAMMATLVYGRSYAGARDMLRGGEMFTLALFSLLGMFVMISGHNFVVIYLGLELLSLSSYALVALRRDDGKAVEAAMKYFVLGSMASGFLLYGMSMVYGATGSLDLSEVVRAIAGGEQTLVGSPHVLTLGLVFMMAGLAFKLGVVPFHMWVPDVYHGAPTAMTLFIGSAPKIAAFAFVVRILGQGLESQVAEWRDMLVILAVLSMAVGNIAAIAQTNLKRMLAYSTISHMGFMLLGILAGSQNGYGSAMFYVLVYALMSLGSFGMILLLSRAGFEADKLDDFKGLNRRSPWLAFLMLLLMFSMAGVPPTVGFYAKLSVLQAVVEIGYVWLAVVAVLFSLIGAFYYLRIVKLMYFDTPHDTAPIVASPDSRVIMSANGLAVLALGIMPQPLMAVCVHAIGASF